MKNELTIIEFISMIHWLMYASAVSKDLKKSSCEIFDELFESSSSKIVIKEPHWNEAKSLSLKPLLFKNIIQSQHPDWYLYSWLKGTE